MSHSKRSVSPVMDSSSTKRRKPNGRETEMKHPKALTWPKGVLPVEIYSLIISFLPRSSIEHMRLVNHEFDRNVIAELFKVVVVPFRPEIYASIPEAIRNKQDGTDTLKRGGLVLQDKGMKVFEQFGGHVRKFAMSFEIDEHRLANPPIKSDQEAITSFWGIYRWPFKKYNRYSQLEGLEQTADETRTMAKALSCIKQSRELGISIDGGLGWLAGPDINLRVLERAAKPAVFGPTRFASETSPKPRLTNSGKLQLNMSTTDGNDLYSSYERMLVAAGYNGQNLEPSVSLLLQSEQLDGPGPTLPHLQGSLESSTNQLIRSDNSYQASPMCSSNAVQSSTGAAHNNDSDVIILTGGNKSSNVQSQSLKPNDLTNAQREMLLEIEWAQRAFMQSYAIAVIDNPATFCHVESLTIARLPSRHVTILRRGDFWDSLPGLSKLSLAIIPDWREVTKLPTSWVADHRLAPSLAISGIFRLLQEQIAGRDTIRTLHFEWLCGGEDSPGLCSRNQHILAAPIVDSGRAMINRMDRTRIISLPHIEHLSLKNCWLSPHILSAFAQEHRPLSLKSMKFESVSLSAFVTRDTQPLPHHDAAAVAHPQNPHIAQVQNLGQLLNGAANGQAPASAPTEPGLDYPDWLRPPRIGSWASFIENFLRGETPVWQERLKNSDETLQDYTYLTEIKFDSCGYIKLPLAFDQEALFSADGATGPTAATMKRREEIEEFMMRPKDPLLGTVINHISTAETSILENRFALSIGWGPDRKVQLADSLLDGVVAPGQGRFQGVLLGDS